MGGRGLLGIVAVGIVSMLALAVVLPGIVGSDFPLAAPVAPPDEGTSELAAQQWVSWTSYWMLLITGFGVLIVTLTYAQSRSILKEARRTNDAAMETIDVARQASETEAQAYLEAAEGELLVHDSKLSLPRVILSVTNSGKTPANRFTMGLELRVAREQQEKHSYKRPSESGLRTWTGLGGSTTKTVSFRFFEQSELFQKALNLPLEYTLFFDGLLRYETLFGGVYETEFQFFWSHPREFRNKVVSKTVGLTTNREVGQKLSQPTSETLRVLVKIA